MTMKDQKNSSIEAMRFIFMFVALFGCTSFH